MTTTFRRRHATLAVAAAAVPLLLLGAPTAPAYADDMGPTPAPAPNPYPPVEISTYPPAFWNGNDSMAPAPYIAAPTAPLTPAEVQALLGGSGQVSNPPPLLYGPGGVPMPPELQVQISEGSDFGPPPD
ncbi:hypothetical protein C8E89_1102 [Mycolicibacterium moriokaense]|uniref:Fibronectin attachment protein n=1 Tax=Mycolicibacterium moriokaense TaxID=39691 RepID=A0A318HEN9_9MYCO|nr:hypothetical protein C8E89_1102 [Mycolicibacterium moriokaense]